MARVRKEKTPLPVVKCGDSDCANGLHVYREKRKKRNQDYEGVPCRECGDDSIDWEQFKNRDLSNTELTFNTLKKEYIRNVFWNLKIDESFQDELCAKGIHKIEQDVDKRIASVIKKCGKEIFRDGTQTPLNKYNIIYFAQHATATCCRKCIKIWHNIPYDKELNNKEMKYVKGLIMEYIKRKLPVLVGGHQLEIFK